ncbi:MAG: hypothetical protein ACREF3_04285 [Acetobacteraceae bacterium]
MAILTVGAGHQYTTIAAAVAASNAGDTIQVVAGTYQAGDLFINHDLTFRAVGGAVNIVAPDPDPDGNVAKGLFVIGTVTTTPKVTIQGFNFSGATSAQSNGAGIRYQSGNLVLKNDTFTNNQDGILATPFVENTGTILVENSVFNHNGAGDGQSHNMYIGEIASFTLLHSLSENAVVGHEVKSRAFNNVIEDNTISDGPTGTASYSIDLPNGGDDIIQGNTIEKGPDSETTVAIHFGGPALLNPNSSLIVADNKFINDNVSWTTAVLNQSLVPVQVTGNEFTRFSAGGILSGVGSTLNNTDPGTPLPNETNTDFGNPRNTLDERGNPSDQTITMTTAGETLQGGSGNLTITTDAPFENIIGGAGGINLTADWGPYMVYTAPGSTNTMLFNNPANAIFSAGTDAITLAYTVGTPWINVTGTTMVTELPGVPGAEYTIGAGGTLTLNGAGSSDTVSVQAGGAATLTGVAGLSLFEQDGSLGFTTPGFSATFIGGAVQATTGGALNINTYDIGHGSDEATLQLQAGSFNIQSAGGGTIEAGGASHVSVTNANDAITFIGGSGSGYVWTGGGTANVVAGSGNITIAHPVAAPGGIFEVDATTGGGLMTIDDFREGLDQLVYNGFAGNPVMSEQPANGGLQIVLTNSTTIALPGVWHL